MMTLNHHTLSILREAHTAAESYNKIPLIKNVYNRMEFPYNPSLRCKGSADVRVLESDPGGR